MKRVLALALILVLALTLVACGGNKEEAEEVPADFVEEGPTAGFREFRWPRSEIAGLIPVPASNFGEILWENSEGFYISVGNTSQEEYDAYVDECLDRGFTVDYWRGDGLFFANNEAGYNLSLNYEDNNNVMQISISAPYDDPSGTLQDDPTPTPETPETSETPESTETPETTPANGSTADYDWQQWLKDYEEWVDDYIAFMEKYNKNPTDMTLLSDYLAFTLKAVEWAEQAETLEDELTGDDLKEYLATMTRIAQKLIAIVD